jgi:glutathione S-transferase
MRGAIDPPALGATLSVGSTSVGLRSDPLHRPDTGEVIMLTLYFAPGSSSMAPHIALHEIGVDFDARPVSFGRKENRTLAYLALNPEGKVPTLLIEGRPLTEVAGILFYLAKRFPAAGLLPSDDIEAEAQAISWMSFIAATLHPARRRGLDDARRVYALADRRLGGRPWAIGRYSIADIHLFRLYWRFANSLQPAQAEFPNLEAHYRRMMVRPAVQKTCEIEARIGYELPG